MSLVRHVMVEGNKETKWLKKRLLDLKAVVGKQQVRQRHAVSNSSASAGVLRAPGCRKWWRYYVMANCGRQQNDIITVCGAHSWRTSSLYFFPDILITKVRMLKRIQVPYEAVFATIAKKTIWSSFIQTHFPLIIFPEPYFKVFPFSFLHRLFSKLFHLFSLEDIFRGS